MNSFTLTGVGTLARNPELSVEGGVTSARFCLIGHDPPSPSRDGGESMEEADATSLWFFAFGDIATEIARKSRKGDQLILQARVVEDSWLEEGERQYGHTFIVTGFRFGAKRGGNGPAASSRCAKPPGKPQPDAAQAGTDAVPQELAEAAAGL